MAHTLDRTVDENFIYALYDYLAEAPQWSQQGSCVDKNINVIEDKKDMKKLCSSCPVKEKCLEWAYSHDVKSGIYGGKDFSS